MKTLRFAIVGAGGIARAYDAAFKETYGAKIAAVCDVLEPAAEELARSAACPSFRSVSDLVSGVDFDAAVVCTPPATHEDVACQLLRAGKHVLCEKPLAIDVGGAKRMLDAARQSGTILTMASKFRYAADVRKARELLMSGAIGELVFAENAFTTYVDMRHRWNSNAEVSGGGVLMDNGTHAVDILRYFLGTLRDIQVVEGRRMQGLAVEDTVRLFVHNTDGVMGAADLSWSIDKELDTYLRVYGSAGTILVGWKGSRFRRRHENEWRSFGTGYDKIQAFRDQLSNFCGAIRGTERLVVTPDDGLASVEVIAAAYSALSEARWQGIASAVNEFEFAPLSLRKQAVAS